MSRMNKIGATIPLEALQSLPATMQIQRFQKIHIVFSVIDNFQTISVRCFENHNIQVCSIIFIYQGNQTPWKGLRMLPMRIPPYQMLNIQMYVFYY